MPAHLSATRRDFDLADRRIAGFHFKDRLGKSTFPVWRAREVLDNDRYGREFAVKVFVTYPDETGHEKKIMDEVEALSRLKAHSSLVQYYFPRQVVVYVRADSDVLYQSVDDAEDDGVGEGDLERVKFSFVAMELIDGGSLRQRERAGEEEEYLDLARRDPLRACRHLAKVAEALELVHLNQAHRDIKPANLFWSKSEDKVVVGDFGLARSLDPAISPSGGIAGTFPYLAPEGFTPPQTDLKNLDIYAFGVTLYQIFTGRLPVDIPPEADAGNPIVVFNLWNEAHARPDRPHARQHCPWMSVELSATVRKAMDPNPALRPDMQAIRVALTKEWDEQLSAPAPRRDRDPPSYLEPDGPVLEMPDYVFHPAVRTDLYGETSYHVELHVATIDPNVVQGFHRIFAAHVGPSYRFVEAYGRWSFLASFWCPADKDLAPLWRELSAGSTEVRVTRSSSCALINRKGAVVELRPRRMMPEYEVSHHIYVLLNDPDVAVRQQSLARLVGAGVLQRFEPEHGPLIHACCYLVADDRFSATLSASRRYDTIKTILCDTIRKSGGIVRAELYVRSQDAAKSVPTNFRGSPADFVVSYVAKKHQDLFLIPRAFVKETKGVRPDTRIATGWYHIWREIQLADDDTGASGCPAPAPPDASAETDSGLAKRSTHPPELSKLSHQSSSHLRPTDLH